MPRLTPALSLSTVLVVASSSSAFAQLEVKSAISQCGFVINAPGSYYLSKSLTCSQGITIASDNVSLDLRGHTLRGRPGSGSGIVVDDFYRGITIRNGFVSEWGVDGIDARKGRSFLAEAVTATGNGNVGIWADEGILRDCIASENGLVGIQGFSLSVDNCRVARNVLDGMSIAGGPSRITRSAAWRNGRHGISVGAFVVVLDNNVSYNGTSGAGAGITVSGLGARLENNTLTANPVGIDVKVDRNLVRGNFASANTVDYDVVPGNIFGPVVDANSVATSCNPHANY